MGTAEIITIVTFGLTVLSAIVTFVYKLGGIGKSIGDINREIVDIKADAKESKKIADRVLELEITTKIARNKN